MVVAGGVGDAEVELYDVDEGRLGQGDAAAAEISRDLEDEPVATGGHRRRVEQRPAGVAAVGVEFDGADRVDAALVDALEPHLHAGGRTAVCGVENVRAEVAHVVWQVSSAKCIHCGVQVNIDQTAAARGRRRRPAPKAESPGTTDRIVESITTAIVERRLMPGTKLAEQRIADIFAVSRTVVRQALNRLSRDRLVTLEPARGAFVATPGVDEARQVFEVRQMIEGAIVRRLCSTVTDAQIAELKAHLSAEKAAVSRSDVAARTRLLADFHTRIATMLGNAVMREMLADLLGRSSLIALMYQTSPSAEASHAEHVAIVEALAKRDARAVVRLTEDHLEHVERNLRLDPRPTDLSGILNMKRA